MKWAILSDVHGNLEAFRAVKEDLEKGKADRIAFLGDIVGYGADPNACLTLLEGIVELAVAGNHDYGVVGLTDITFFNSVAKAALLWTRREVSAKGNTFLRNLPLQRQAEGMTFVHSTPNGPEEWNYIFTLSEAREAFRALQGDVAFIGHSHRPMIWVERGEGTVTALEDSQLILEEGARYLTNVGSVGQPRDGNPHAAYGFYDTSSRKFFLKRVPYDIETAKKKIIQAGLSPYLAHRLSQGA